MLLAMLLAMSGCATRPHDDNAAHVPATRNPMELIEALCTSIAEDREADWNRPEFWRLEPIRSDRTKALERALIELGPDAIPSLLAHLNDDRPAGFGEVCGFSLIGTTIADMEIEGRTEVIRSPFRHGDAGWGTECAAMHGDPMEGEGLLRPMVSPMKVGDVCFCVLGMIVNRNYLFIRHVPSNVTKLRSPVHQAWLAAGLRKAWGGNAITENLRQSLYADLGGRPVQITGPQPYRDSGAAERLQLYFPSEYASLAEQARAATGELFTPAGTDIKVRRDLFN